MEKREPFVAMALLTQRDMDLYGAGLRNLYSIASNGQFDELLRAIDHITASLPQGTESTDRQTPP